MKDFIVWHETYNGLEEDFKIIKATDVEDARSKFYYSYPYIINEIREIQDNESYLLNEY